MRYLSHVDKYLTLKYKYKYKYFKMVLEYYSSTSTSTKYYISAFWNILTTPIYAKGTGLDWLGKW